MAQKEIPSANKENKNYKSFKFYSGLLLILLSFLMVWRIPCPSKIQILVIEIMLGLGVALLLPKSADKSKFKSEADNYKLTLTGAVVIPIFLVWWDPVSKIVADGCRLNTNITVQVYGKGGAQDIVLKQGYVRMDIVRKDIKKEPINENGQASFKNLQINDSVRLSIDFSEPYHPINPDSIYIIKPGAIIYLPVALEGIGEIKGMVLYHDYPLENVIVKLNLKKGTFSDTTDRYGAYHFLIPDSLQLKSYQLWFIKKGFRAKSAPAYPETGTPLNITMEKQ